MKEKTSWTASFSGAQSPTTGTLRYTGTARRFLQRFLVQLKIIQLGHVRLGFLLREVEALGLVYN